MLRPIPAIQLEESSAVGTVVTVSLPDTLIKAVKHECRSTSVTMWFFFEPLIRSPLPQSVLRFGPAAR
jgi:hypothetical protein